MRNLSEVLHIHNGHSVEQEEKPKIRDVDRVIRQPEEIQIHERLSADVIEYGKRKIARELESSHPESPEEPNTNEFP